MFIVGILLSSSSSDIVDDDDDDDDEPYCPTTTILLTRYGVRKSFFNNFSVHNDVQRYCPAAAAAATMKSRDMTRRIVRRYGGGITTTAHTHTQH